MDGRFNTNPFLHDQDKLENSPQHGSESPPSSGKPPSTSSPKRSRRAMQKRVVSVPIRDVESSRLKGEGAPPSDSWAWRKYGQKPIKGSPYPRGYYRCSSSKGCPARKQVERSRVDPTMLVVTYSCEHNHPWPASRNNHHHSSSAAAAASPPSAAAASPSEPTVDTLPEEQPDLFTTRHDIDDFVDIGGCGGEFAWFSDMDTSSSTMLHSPVFLENGEADVDATVFFPMGEEDASLFADLEELPECSVVFRRVVVDRRPPLSAEIS